MDCEKFDQILIDALYDELDELTLAAAKRHAEGCQRCQASWSGLRATLKVGVVPVVDPPASLEPGILQAAREAHGNVAWPKRVGRAISWAGSYAMRPQTAMAAILVLMLGSSVIFVRRKPDRSGPSRVSVTERGVPEQTAEEMRPERLGGMPRERAVAQGRTSRREGDDRAPSGGGPFAAAPAPAREAPAESEARAAKGAAEKADDYVAAKRAPSANEIGLGALAEPAPAATAAADGVEAKKDWSGAGPSAPGDVPAAPKDAYGAAMELYTAGHYAEADKAFTAVASSGAKNAALAGLYAAKSTESAYGCGRAAAKYESAAQRFAGTSAGAEAQWEAAKCHKVNGNFDRARTLYIELRSVAGYRDRAEGELENLKILQQQFAAKASRAAPPAKAAAPPAEAPASPPRTTPSQ